MSTPQPIIWFDEPLPTAKAKPVCPKCGSTKPAARPYVVVEYFSSLIGRMVGNQQYGSVAHALGALRSLGGKPDTHRFKVTARMMACQNLWCRYEGDQDEFLTKREPAVKLAKLTDEAPQF